MESLIQIFSSEVMYALSWTIMHSIWQGLIIAIVLALFIKLTPRLRANTKYVISCIAMLLLFTLSAITFYSYYELEGTYAAFETVLTLVFWFTVFLFSYDIWIFKNSKTKKRYASSCKCLE